jgi:O-Antigen ligase
MSERAVPLASGRAASIVARSYAAASSSRAGWARVRLVELLVLATFLLCMSAPEELFFTHVESELNPFVGVTKLSLLGLALAILLLCPRGRRHWAIAGPFGMLMVWSVVCWVVAGADILPARNLVSSFGGILVLAAFSAAAELLGGIRILVRLLVCALIVGALTSVLLGVMGFQAMPGELASPWQLEWFHGIGIPAYVVAGCAVLIAWVLARHISGPGVWMELGVLALLVIPAMSFLRAYLIGIVVSIIVAAFFAFRNSRRKNSDGRMQGYHSGYKRLLRLVVVTLGIGTVIFFLKTTTREEGNELSGREIVWPIEIASVVHHPLFGLGPFGDVQLLFFDEQLPQVGAAHSDYLGAAVCYGVPGLLLFCGAFYGMWKRILRYRAVSLDDRACRYAALLSLVGLSTTMIAENVIRDPRLFALHLLFPALCLSAGAINQKKATK